MSRTLMHITAATALLASAAQADAPRVAADIAPVHSLVARVMEGVGVPDLIVPPGGSPHEHSLRPSEARALQDADLVFWVSPDLTPWLADAIESLVGTAAGTAAVTTLLDTDGTVTLTLRDGALFEVHEHESDAAHSGHEEHEEHEDHEDHGDHEDHSAHEGHGADQGHDLAAESHGPSEGGRDAHAWLSPQNASIWLQRIATELSAADPDNASLYAANAAAARSEIDTLIAEIEMTLAPVRAGRFIVFHDAYQYFEVAFDFPAAGAISLGDATDPSPARIAEIRARIAAEGIDCVLAEPQFNPGLVATVLEGTEAATGVMDPLGSDLEPGATLYPRMMRNLAATLAGCL